MCRNWLSLSSYVTHQQKANVSQSVRDPTLTFKLSLIGKTALLVFPFLYLNLFELYSITKGAHNHKKSSQCMISFDMTIFFNIYSKTVAASWKDLAKNSQCVAVAFQRKKKK